MDNNTALLIKQSEMIENLVELYREVLVLLANYMDVETYETKLKVIIESDDN